MLEFIQEICEARIYNDGNTLKGKTAEEIAKIAFLTVMMLEIMRTTDLGYSKKYANDTLPNQGFDSMRPSATDLHNLLVVLSNQDKYSDKIKENSKISVPTLQMKRYLRDVANGKKELALDRQFFKTLEDFFNITDSSLKNIRRSVADWATISSTEKSSINISIKQLANSMTQQNDLYQQFKNSV